VLLQFAQARLSDDLLVSCEKYAQAVGRFLSTGPNYGARVDFQKRNLVGIGHSLGANAMWVLFLTRFRPT